MAYNKNQDFLDSVSPYYQDFLEFVNDEDGEKYPMVCIVLILLDFSTNNNT